MADQKTYTVQDFKGLLAAELRKQMAEWEDVYVDLRKRELAKDDSSHYEPGNHETPDTGVAPHMEPGTHESHAMGPGGLAVQPAQEPVGSDTGVPMNGQPTNSTPGGEICPMCNQPDLPGSCQCLGGTAQTPDAGGGDVDGFDGPDANLGPDAALGGGALALSEKPLAKAQKRKVTAHQVRAMATRKDELDDVVDSVKGVYGSVKTAALSHEAEKKKAATAKKGEMDGGGGSSPVESGMGDMDGGTPGLSQSEPLDKDLASATAELRTQNKLLNAANQIRAPKYGLGDQKPMSQKFSKEEWIDIANEGDPVKRLKNFPDGANETAVPASSGNKGAKKRGQDVESKTVEGATSEKYPVTKGVKKGEIVPEKHKAKIAAQDAKMPKPMKDVMSPPVKKADVPMAKPPSGQNMGTAVPKAKVAAPKLPGAAAPKIAAPPAPKLPKPPGMGTMGKGELPFKKAALPAGKQMAMHANAAAHQAHGTGAAPAPAVKLPGAAADAARAQMYSDFTPKPAAGPNVPGLKAPPAAMKATPPKLPGMGAKPAAPAPKPMFGKGEMEDLKCSMCSGAEHAGDCK